MAKINISFNNKNYTIDEASLSSALAALKSHLSTTMNGTGAVITLDGVSYNVDSTKLSAATTDFVNHLGTISGTGHKVMVGGVEYGVGADKVAGAVGELGAALDGLNNPAEPEGEKKFKTILRYPDMDATDLCEGMNLQHGAQVAFNEAVLPTKTNDGVKLSTQDDSFVMYFYYIEDESDIFIYGYNPDSNTNEWIAYSMILGVPFNGAITDMSQATEIGLYALIYTDTPSTPIEERLEGDGAEYYTLAPTALSFRSTAPLNELQEIQINGVTVDPSNYTLEEGSTIVTFPIEYLKTLNVGSYEVAVASDSKTVKGDFNVKAPQLNEHGFYYNQPYTAYVGMLGTNVSFFVREDGTFDSIDGVGITETGSYEISGNSIVSTNSMGTLNSTISSDGMEIYCTELGVTFVLGNDNVVADGEYIYFYDSSLEGYVVAAIDRKTKASFGPIRTGINGKPTVKLRDFMFEDNTNLVAAPEIPDTVTTIGERAFTGCTNLSSIKLPDNITSIGRAAFIGCTSLSNIDIPKNVISIGDTAFQETNLISISIPNGVTTIESLTFNSCSNLAHVTIPDSVTRIQNSFGNCTSLTSITFEGTIAQWNAISKSISEPEEHSWNYNVPATHVQCSDGQVAL